MTRLKKAVLAMTAIFSLWGETHAENVVMHTPDNFQILSLSPNGKWACGVFVDAAGNAYGFRWNLEGGSIEMLDNEPSTAYDVANDGTVSGDFNDPDALPNGAPVVMPGYWRDGKWHGVEMPAGNITDGIGYGISPDGQYITGSIAVNGVYTPFIWRNGAIHRNLDTNHDAVSMGVAPDGSGATGFDTQYNRTACYWVPNGDVVLFKDSKDYSQTPWNYGRNFSPDGSKIVYWGGWEVDSDDNVYLYAIYDIKTGERIRVKAPAYDSDVEFYDISNNGLLVGADRSRGYVYANGVGMPIDDYLASRGVDLSNFDDFYSQGDYYVNQLPISCVVAVSEDENIFAMRYFNKAGQTRSMIVKIDQDFSKVVPAEIKAVQLDGINTAALTWKRPAGVSSVRGYNIYRNGKKINGILPINVPYYYDNKLAAGTYEYEVSAISQTGEETRSEVQTVTITDPEPQAPNTLFARQKGVNGALVSWEAPLSDMVHKRYFSFDGPQVEAFGIYEPLNIEFGIGFDKNEIANYKGFKISEVSFYPMSEQYGWAVNLYKRNADGQLTLIVSQPVTQQLVYGELNTVEFDAPVDLPDDNLVVAVEALVSPYNQRVIGAVSGVSTAGYSDLMRQKTDDAFFSIWDSSVESGYSLTQLCWAIDLGLVNPEKEDALKLSGYNIYVDDNKVGDTKANSYVISTLDDGDHTVSVEAVYTDGSASPIVPVDLSIKANYQPVSDVKVSVGNTSKTEVTASWSAPIDCDLTPITYTTDKKHSSGIMGTESNSYALMVAADYPASMLRGYEGYEVKTFSFYPLADAIFTFMLYKDEEEVYELEVEDFKLGQWNVIEVPDQVLIEKGATYRLILDCFDPEPGVRLMAIDNDCPRPNVSDLYSIDNGMNWNSLSIETGAYGSWMIGMTIADKESAPMAVDGYDVVIDGKTRNTSMITTNEFKYDFGKMDDAEHSLAVNVYYPARNESVAGDVTKFYLSVSGFEDTMIANIDMHTTDNYLIVSGESVQSVEIYSAAGVQVASSPSNQVEISHLSSGVYIVVINVNGKNVTRKINIL